MGCGPATEHKGQAVFARLAAFRAHQNGEPFWDVDETWSISFAHQNYS